MRMYYLPRVLPFLDRSVSLVRQSLSRASTVTWSSRRCSMLVSCVALCTFWPMTAPVQVDFLLPMPWAYYAVYLLSFTNYCYMCTWSPFRNRWPKDQTPIHSTTSKHVVFGQHPFLWLTGREKVLAPKKTLWLTRAKEFYSTFTKELKNSARFTDIIGSAYCRVWVLTFSTLCVVLP